MPAPPSDDRPCTCAALRRAARAVTALYDDALRPTGLRITQFAILRLLARFGPMPVTRLAAEAELSRSTMGRNLDPLERRGLVLVSIGEADGRERHAELTEAGRAAIADALPFWRAAQREVAARIEPGSVHALADALDARAA